MLFIIAAIIIAVLGAFMIHVGFTGTGPRQRYRAANSLCTACGYPKPADASVCSECGHTFAAAIRRRPALVVAGLGMLLFAPPIGFAGPRENEPFHNRVIPSTIVCLFERFRPCDTGKEIDNGFIARLVAMRAGQLWPWQTKLALGSRWNEGLKTGLVQMPTKWPAGLPLRIHAGGFELPCLDWAWTNASVISTLAPDQVAFSRLMQPPGSCAMGGGPSRSSIDIPTPPTPQVLRVPVTWRITLNNAIVAEESREFAVQLVVSTEPILEIRSGPEIDDSVRRDISVDYLGGDGVIVYFKSLNRINGFRLGAALELRDGTTVVGSGSTDSIDFYNLSLTDAAYIDPEAMPRLLRRGLTLRVKGDEHIALRLFGAKSCWKGQIEVPLDDVLQVSDDPTRPPRPQPK